MILPRSVDASCRNSKIHIIYKASSRKNDKAIANRKYRRRLKSIARDICNGVRDWDEEAFDELKPMTSWDID